jgi:hypothetical protein
MSDAGDVGKIVERKDDGMAKKTKKPNQNMQAWIEARKRHHLSHAQVHMARELGMNPAKLGKIDNHKQQPWKLPLPQFIEELYGKRFGKTSPEAVLSIEERCRLEAAKKEERRTARLRAVDSPTTPGSSITLTESDGNKSRANPIGVIGDVGPRHATFGGSRPQ